MTLPQVIICKPNLKSFLEEAIGKVYVLQVQQKYPQAENTAVHIAVSGLNSDRLLLRYEFTAALFKSYLTGSKKQVHIDQVNELEKELINQLKKAGLEVQLGMMTFGGFEIPGSKFNPEEYREGVEL